MNAEIKTRWVNALRSGDYQQGVEYLHYGGVFCPLGVLANITDPMRWNPKKPGPEDPPFTTVFRYDYCIYCLPYALSAEWGIPWELEKKIMELNDEEKLSFAKIADWIEENL